MMVKVKRQNHLTQSQSVEEPETGPVAAESIPMFPLLHPFLFMNSTQLMIKNAETTLKRLQELFYS